MIPSGPILVELCAGTAALTLDFAGRLPPVPTTGCKRHYAKQIRAILGLPGRPTEAHLVEPGEWGHTLEALFGADGPQKVAQLLRDWAPEHDRALFDRLRSVPAPVDPVERVATFLYLQTRTYRGKPVSPTEEGWNTHGFDAEYREAVTEGAKSRGWYNARPVLADKVEAVFSSFPFPTHVHQGRAEAMEIIPGAFLYLDPPYQDAEGYPDDFSREQVCETAERWASTGCTVVISEGEALKELGPQWKSIQLVPYRKTRSFGHAEEWLTFRIPG